MKTLILKTHSPENARLYQASISNHVQYAERHGYDLLTLNRPYSEVMLSCLDLIKNALKEYDMVVTVGSDVLFTRMETPMSFFLFPEDVGVVISDEDIGGSAVNADLIIWRDNAAGERVMARLQAMHADLKDHPWGIQQAFNLIRAKNELPNSDIRFTPCRCLQSTHVKGFPRSMWKPGDFAIHFLGMSNETKYLAVSHFMGTGEVLWRD